MKAIDSTTSHRNNRIFCRFFRGRATSSAGLAILASLLTFAGFAEAGQPLITVPTTASLQAQNAQSITANSNQAVMSQIITQLNQRQTQLSITAAQAAARNAAFVPQQTFRISRGK